ncbi:MAG: 23S rRNA (guanosine(2251)-2'-O)-methyltransferase RlmB [Chloroflexota bacterium]
METEWLYGRNSVREALRANRRTFYSLRLAANLDPDRRIDEILSLCQKHAIEVESVARSQLDEIVEANHQGVALQCSRFPYSTGEELIADFEADALLLALDNVQDPRNVGSLLRTSEAVGVRGVVIPEHRSASITPAVSNSSAGAVEHLSIAGVTNLARWLKAAKSARYWTVGLDGGEGVPAIFDVDIPMPAVLVVGAEGTGLRRLILETCDLTVAIPMYGRIESLNAAVSGSIALYEIREFAESS